MKPSSNQTPLLSLHSTVEIYRLVSRKSIAMETPKGGGSRLPQGQTISVTGANTGGLKGGPGAKAGGGCCK